MQRVRRFPKDALLRGLARVAARETRFRDHLDRSRKEKEMSFVKGGTFVPGCRDLFEVLQQSP